jgi:hypothetical protein
MHAHILISLLQSGNLAAHLFTDSRDRDYIVAVINRGCTEMAWKIF